MRRTRGPAVRRWASSNFHVGRDRYVVAVMGPGRAGVVVPIQCSAGRRASRSVPLPRSCSVAAGATHGTCRRWGNRQQVTVSHSSTGRASRRSIRTRIPSHHTRSSVSSIPPPVSFGGRRPIERGPADLLARSPVPVGAGDYPAPAAPGPCTICTSTCTHEIDWSTARRPFRVRLTIPPAASAHVPGMSPRIGVREPRSGRWWITDGAPAAAPGEGRRPPAPSPPPAPTVPPGACRVLSRRHRRWPPMPQRSPAGRSPADTVCRCARTRSIRPRRPRPRAPSRPPRLPPRTRHTSGLSGPATR